MDEIESAASEVKLKRLESELRRAADTEAGPMALSHLLSARVLGLAGNKHGRVHDVVATRPAGSDDPWELHCLLVGRHALLPRIGFSPAVTKAIYQGQMPAGVVTWTDVERFDDDGSVIVRN